MSDIEKYEKMKRLVRIPLAILLVCLIIEIIASIWSRDVRLSTVLMPFTWLTVMTGYGIVCCKLELLKKIENIEKRCNSANPN